MVKYRIREVIYNNGVIEFIPEVSIDGIKYNSSCMKSCCESYTDAIIEIDNYKNLINSLNDKIVKEIIHEIK